MLFFIPTENREEVNQIIEKSHGISEFITNMTKFTADGKAISPRPPIGKTVATSAQMEQIAELQLKVDQGEMILIVIDFEHNVKIIDKEKQSQEEK